jgi:tetratricopeptide (TPR) repeat protein
VFDVATGKSLLELEGPWADSESSVVARYGRRTGATFSPDGTQLVVVGEGGSARLLDSVPYRERLPKLRAFEEALDRMSQYVRTRIEAGAMISEVRRQAVSDPSIAEHEREAVLVLTQALREAERTEAERLAGQLQAVSKAVTPDSADAREIAVRAERLISIAGDDRDFLGIAGSALYRAGRFEAALATLERAAVIRTRSSSDPWPPDLAFLAMSHWKLGHKQEARALQMQFRELTDRVRWLDARAGALFNELHATIGLE